MNEVVRLNLRILPFVAIGLALWTGYYFSRGGGWWATALFWVAIVYWVTLVIAWARMTKPYR